MIVSASTDPIPFTVAGEGINSINACGNILPGAHHLAKLVSISIFPEGDCEYAPTSFALSTCRPKLPTKPRHAIAHVATSSFTAIWR